MKTEQSGKRQYLKPALVKRDNLKRIAEGVVTPVTGVVAKG